MLGTQESCPVEVPFHLVSGEVEHFQRGEAAVAVPVRFRPGKSGDEMFRKPGLVRFLRPRSRQHHAARPRERRDEGARGAAEVRHGHPRRRDPIQNPGEVLGSEVGAGEVEARRTSAGSVADEHDQQPLPGREGRGGSAELGLQFLAGAAAVRGAGAIAAFIRPFQEHPDRKGSGGGHRRLTELPGQPGEALAVFPGSSHSDHDHQRSGASLRLNGSARKGPDGKRRGDPE